MIKKKTELIDYKVLLDGVQVTVFVPFVPSGPMCGNVYWMIADEVVDAHNRTVPSTSLVEACLVKTSNSKEKLEKLRKIEKLAREGRYI